MSNVNDPLSLLKNVLNDSPPSGNMANDMPSNSYDDNLNNSGNRNSNTGFYELLGVSKIATKQEIKKAYRSKARVMHPDRIQARGNANFVKEEAERAFHDLTFAYQTLMDDNLRAMYDVYGETAIDGKLKIDITKINLMDLFDSLYDESDEKNAMKKPPKIYVVTRYDQMDLKTGWKEMSYDYDETCSKCEGSGRYGQFGDRCFQCGGKGIVSKGATVRVPLSKKNLNKRDMTFDGRGHKLADYLQPGDLIMRLRYCPKETTNIHNNRNNNNNNNNNNGRKKELTVHISLYEAMYGINRPFFLSNGRSVPVCEQGPFQSGQKLDVNGVSVVINVQIPDPAKVFTDHSQFEGFKLYMSYLGQWQQDGINAKNNKSFNKINEEISNSRGCAIM